MNDRELYSSLQQTTGAIHDTMVQARAGVTAIRIGRKALDFMRNDAVNFSSSFNVRTLSWANGPRRNAFSCDVIALFSHVVRHYLTAPGHQIEDKDDERHNQQDMDQPPGNVKAKTEKPQNQNNYEGCPKHFESFSNWQCARYLIPSRAHASSL